MYASGITFTGVAAAGGSGGITGADDGLSISTVDPTKSVWGQNVGDAANPAQLLEDREIPFSGFEMTFVDGLNTDAVQSFVTLWSGVEVPIRIRQNGDGSIGNGNGGFFMNFDPVNYQHTYADGHAPGGMLTMQNWTLSYILGDNGEGGTGMPDAVINLGYNTDIAGGRASTEDAAWRLGFETNFLGEVGGVGLDFEFHLPEITCFDGTIVRVNSYYTRKDTAQTLNQKFVDETDFISVLSGNIFCEIQGQNSGNAGLLILQGTGASGFADGVLQMQDTASGQAVQILKRGNILFLGWNDSPNSSMDITGNWFFNQNEGSTVGVALGTTIFGQNGSPFEDAVASALVAILSTTQGFLPPSMSTVQKNAIVAPATGLMVYDNTLNKLAVFTGAAWETVTSI